MIRKIRSILRREEGQGMTEYIIIVALIAIAAIGIMAVFGDTVREQFGRITASLQGRNYTGKSAERNIINETKNRDLQTYDDQANHAGQQ